MRLCGDGVDSCMHTQDQSAIQQRTMKQNLISVRKNVVVYLASPIVLCVRALTSLQQLTKLPHWLCALQTPYAVEWLELDARTASEFADFSSSSFACNVSVNLNTSSKEKTATRCNGSSAMGKKTRSEIFYFKSEVGFPLNTNNILQPLIHLCSRKALHLVQNCTFYSITYDNFLFFKSFRSFVPFILH